MTMIKLIHKVFFRQAQRNKAFYFTSFALMIIGISSWNFLWSYIIHELEYDQFHANKDQIYRLRNDRYKDGELDVQDAATYCPVGGFLKDNLPEVQDFNRLMYFPFDLTYKEKDFTIQNPYYTDPNFFSMFSFPLIKGNKETCLQGTDKIVISKSLAKKLFGKEDPIGKEIETFRPLEITGVFDDSQASHMKIDVLTSWDTYIAVQGKEILEDWYFNVYHTYLLLDKDVDNAELESKINKTVASHVKQHIDPDRKEEFFLQNITDIHLHSQLTGEISMNGNYQLVVFLGVIALLILVVTAINYALFLFVKSLDRSKEIALRKILGSGKKQILFSLFSEYLIQTILVFLLSLYIVYYVSTMHNDLLNLPVNFFTSSIQNNLLSWLTITFVLILVFALAYIYPAYLLVSFDPIASIKGSVSGFRSHFLRKSLLVVQVAIFGGFLYFSIQVLEQISYMENKDLGFKINQKLVIESRNAHYSDSIRNELFNKFNQYPEIKSITNSSIVPGEIGWGLGKQTLKKISAPKEDEFDCEVAKIDDSFLDVFEIELLAGRNFDFNKEKDVTLINEKALHGLGYTNPEDVIGIKVNLWWGQTKEVVGVFKNYHHRSLKEPFTAMCLIPRTRSENFYAINLETKNMRKTVADIESVWESVYPNASFDYFFLDDFYNQQYKYEETFIRNLLFFAAVVFVIVFTGIISFTGYNVKQRRKEIAIRKVVGGSAQNITSMFLKDFIWLVVIAMFVSLPVTLYASGLWMENYVFKTDTGIMQMLLPYLICLVFLLFTVALQVFYSSQENPAVVLKEEGN